MNDDAPDIGVIDPVEPYVAPWCRAGHLGPIEHHTRFGCACPCHKEADRGPS